MNKEQCIHLGSVMLPAYFLDLFQEAVDQNHSSFYPSIIQWKLVKQDKDIYFHFHHDARNQVTLDVWEDARNQTWFTPSWRGTFPLQGG